MFICYDCLCRLILVFFTFLNSDLRIILLSLIHKYMKSIVIFADGGSRGNPGPAAYGYVVFEEGETRLAHDLNNLEMWKATLTRVIDGAEFIGVNTNNQAEWLGVVKAIQKVCDVYGNSISLTICLDSQLVIRQLEGVYKVKKLELKPYHTNAMSNLDKLSHYRLCHVYRQFNSEADALANEAMDTHMKK